MAGQRVEVDGGIMEGVSAGRGAGPVALQAPAGEASIPI